MTVSEAKEVFGDSLTVRYFNGSDYVETEATLSQSTTRPNRDTYPGYTLDPLIFDGDTQWLIYDFDAYNINTNPSYIQVDFTIETTFKTSRFLTCLAIRNGTSKSAGAVSSVFSLPTWDIYDNGSRTQFFGGNTDSYIYAADFGTSSSRQWSSFIPVDISTVDSHTYVTGRACFYGVSGNRIFIRCPMVDQDATFENGDTSGGDSGGGSSVDLTETNGILSTIQGWLSSIAGLITGIPDAISNGLHDLFVPSEDSLTDFKDNMGDLFSDHFGALAEASDIIDGYVDTFSVTDPVTTIDIPSVSIPLGEAEFAFGGQTVSVNPATYSSNFSVVMNALKLIIDIIATILVVNGLRNRFEGLLSGGESDAG